LIAYSTNCRQQSVTPCIELAEQHACAWIIGALCGVRTGAIGQTPHYPTHYLKWKHVTILRELANDNQTANANFTLRINFEYLKGKRYAGKAESTLDMTVTSPKSNRNLPLSLPHRLLVILLRRGYLKDHSTTQSLMDGEEQNIRIRREILNENQYF
jgi:hypothetical protein